MDDVVRRVAKNKDLWAKLGPDKKCRLLGEMLEIYAGMDHESWCNESLRASGFDHMMPVRFHLALCVLA